MLFRLGVRFSGHHDLANKWGGVRRQRPSTAGPERRCDGPFEGIRGVPDPTNTFLTPFKNRQCVSRTIPGSCWGVMQIPKGSSKVQFLMTTHVMNYWSDRGLCHSIANHSIHSYENKAAFLFQNVVLYAKVLRYTHTHNTETLRENEDLEVAMWIDGFFCTQEGRAGWDSVGVRAAFLLLNEAVPLPGYGEGAGVAEVRGRRLHRDGVGTQGGVAESKTRTLVQSQARWYLEAGTRKHISEFNSLVV